MHLRGRWSTNTEERVKAGIYLHRHLHLHSPSHIDGRLAVLAHLVHVQALEFGSTHPSSWCTGIGIGIRICSWCWGWRWCWGRRGNTFCALLEAVSSWIGQQRPPLFAGTSNVWPQQNATTISNKQQQKKTKQNKGKTKPTKHTKYENWHLETGIELEVGTVHLFVHLYPARILCI